MVERFSYDLKKWFRYSVRYLFHQPINEKIKTWTVRFPAKENPNMVKALFDWPIVLQYDVKAKYRLISRKFSGMTFISHKTYPSAGTDAIKAFLTVVPQGGSSTAYFWSAIIKLFLPTFHIENFVSLTLVSVSSNSRRSG